MCNACGFHCCASDCFGGCGCDHCDNPECWSDEDDDDYEDDEPMYVRDASDELGQVLADALKSSSSIKHGAEDENRT